MPNKYYQSFTTIDKISYVAIDYMNTMIQLIYMNLSKSYSNNSTSTFVVDVKLDVLIYYTKLFRREYFLKAQFGIKRFEIYFFPFISLRFIYYSFVTIRNVFSRVFDVTHKRFGAQYIHPLLVIYSQCCRIRRVQRII